MKDIEESSINALSKSLADALSELTKIHIRIDPGDNQLSIPSDRNNALIRMRKIYQHAQLIGAYDNPQLFIHPLMCDYNICLRQFKKIGIKENIPGMNLSEIILDKSFINNFLHPNPMNLAIENFFRGGINSSDSDKEMIVQTFFNMKMFFCLLYISALMGVLDNVGIDKYKSSLESVTLNLLESGTQFNKSFHSIS